MPEEQRPMIDPETGLPAVYGAAEEGVFEDEVFEPDVFEAAPALPATMFIGIG